MAQTEPVQSVMRALDILESVTSSATELSLSEVADLLGLQRATVANLVRTLAKRGYISRETSRSPLRLGPAAWKLVQEAERGALMKRATQRLSVLAGQHPGAHVVLSTWADGQARLVARLDARFPGRAEQPWSEVLNPYTMAQSQVFLAFGHVSVLSNTLIRFNLDDYAKDVFDNVEELEHALAKARQLGYVCPPIDAMNRFRVACPIYDGRQSLVAAAGIYVMPPPPEAERSRVIADLLEAARDISQGSAMPQTGG
ncbi:MAG: helix-turn-helix domain-containing protein [Planctomycetota bacterium]